MRQANTQISRLADGHYQVRVTRGLSAIDVRVNGNQAGAEKVGDYLAGRLDAMLNNVAALGRE